MLNVYSVEIKSLLDFPNFKISEGNFLSVLAAAERYFKEKLETENIRCRRCGLIIGREFKIGVVNPSELDETKFFNFFPAHTKCLDERLNGKGDISEKGELEVNALTFLEVEKDLLNVQGDLDSHLHMLNIEEIE